MKWIIAIIILLLIFVALLIIAINDHVRGWCQEKLYNMDNSTYGGSAMNKKIKREKDEK